MNAKTIIDEELGDAIMTGRAVAQRRRYIVARYLQNERGSEVNLNPDRWELRVELNPYCLRDDAVFDYIKDGEWNKDLADALADADWNGRRPIIVELANGYKVELALAEIAIELV